jgi:hypothetical protein
MTPEKRRRGGRKSGEGPEEPGGASRRSASVRPDESWILEQCGEVALRVFDALSTVESEGRTDFDLASDLDLTLAQVRKGLYRLQDSGLAKRHEHRTGPFSVPSFYTYHANWPEAAPMVAVEGPAKAASADVPDCYRWTE